MRTPGAHTCMRDQLKPLSMYADPWLADPPPPQNPEPPLVHPHPALLPHPAEAEWHHPLCLICHTPVRRSRRMHRLMRRAHEVHLYCWSRWKSQHRVEIAGRWGAPNNMYARQYTFHAAKGIQTFGLGPLGIQCRRRHRRFVVVVFASCYDLVI